MRRRRDPEVCDQVLDLLPRFASGELDGIDRDAVRQHLGECRSCREEAAASEKLPGVLREHLRLPDPPAEFARGVRRRLGGARQAEEGTLEED